MYNLNYNIINCRLNRPTGKPFVPTPRLDPYSASLVLAVPGSVFTAGYVPVFNQTNGFEDISNYIKSASFDYNTSKYTSPLTAHITTVTGSASSPGFVTASTALNKFVDQGYLTAIHATGYKALQVSTDTGSLAGINLDYRQDFVIESWIAFDSTASLTPYSASISGSISYWGLPNKALAIKESETTSPGIGSSSYWYMPGWGGKPDPGVTQYYSGSSWFGTYPYRVSTDTRENTWATENESWNPLEYNHWAISYTASTKVYRHYYNGTLIGTGSLVGDVLNPNPLTSTSASNAAPLFILGSPQSIYPYNQETSNLNIYNTGSGWYIQDFRMYNGTNKNYTGSQFTPPESMVIGIKEPYPIVQP